MVPALLSPQDFWERYYYRVKILAEEEEKRAALLKRATEQTSVGELTWDEFDDEKQPENTESPTKIPTLENPKTEIPTSENPTEIPSNEHPVQNELPQEPVGSVTTSTRSDIPSEKIQDSPKVESQESKPESVEVTNVEAVAKLESPKPEKVIIPPKQDHVESPENIPQPQQPQSQQTVVKKDGDDWLAWG